MIKKVLYMKAGLIRIQSRPKTGRLSAVLKYLVEKGVRNWKDKAKKRENLKHFCQAMGLIGLLTLYILRSITLIT